MEGFWTVISAANDVIWHDYVLLVVFGTGVLFTVWSAFGQYRALTHGVQVVRGVYDDKGDPGAINHFQALSTALSATVGLGNIAGVSIAISLGGPGAVFWMWMVGLVGMALKMTEVTQAMLYRNTDDPENPHGGAMWVASQGFAKISPALAPLGAVVAVLFCLTLLVSTLTGGNMFQAWNVADISFEYFGIPKIVTGIILTVAVGAVIVGGIKRIGDVAGRVVPVMCGIYILAGLYVIVTNLGQVPGYLALIVREAFSPNEAAGAFVGGSAGYAFLKGMQRALFSNEAGQGSAPIAHSAAKTDEPAREGIVAGLEPFVDTLCVCTITALVIMLSGAWDRPPALRVDGPAPVFTQAGAARGRVTWETAPVRVVVADENEALQQMRAGKELFLVVDTGVNPETGGSRFKVPGTLSGTEEEGFTASFGRLQTPEGVVPQLAIQGIYFDHKGATLTAKAFDRVLPGLGKWIVPATAWLFAFSTIISWSYYGEQGVVYLLGLRSVMAYRVVYCLLILVTVQLVRTEAQLDILSTLGTGVMLLVNIPIMLIFGRQAMRAYHEYVGRLKSGTMRRHDAPPLIDVVDGTDVE
ncbi:MAG TPA: amino acid carrier protein [Thermoanaerobaculia bacterium]|nr:amino acid carrier protein [Thermoanaerobaculia bacterium]